jgi:hypothetical protein
MLRNRDREQRSPERAGLNAVPSQVAPTRLQLTWRQAMTPSAGLGSMLLLGALLGLLADLRGGDGTAVLLGAGVVSLIFLYRRFWWRVEIGPDGLYVRRLRSVRCRPALLGDARIVGRVSQLRVEVATAMGTVRLPAPRGLALGADPAFRADVEGLRTYWTSIGRTFETAGMAQVGEPVLTLRRRVVTVWPWLLLGAGSLVWQLVQPTMGGDLTLVSITLIVLLQVRQPRPALRDGLWIADGERFVTWPEVLRLRVTSRWATRRVVVVGDDFHEELAAPVDAWWAPNPRFEQTFDRLDALWAAARMPAEQRSSVSTSH